MQVKKASAGSFRLGPQIGPGFNLPAPENPTAQLVPLQSFKEDIVVRHLSGSNGINTGQLGSGKALGHQIHLFPVRAGRAQV